MFKLAIFVFREGLEIALLLGIIMAVTNPVKNSRIYIIFGLITGVVLASLFAIFTSNIANSFGGLGDEVFNAVVILFTSILISWTVVWMQGYTKKVRLELGELSDKIISGKASGFMLSLMVAASILREVGEIILYVYSVATAGQLSASDYILGVGLGGLFGLTVGSVLYLGLIRYATKYIFQVCSLFLTLIAAGLAAQSAGVFTSSGIIEYLIYPVWDLSEIIDNSSTMGKILNASIGYDSRPNGMQIIFYLSSISFTLGMIKLKSALQKN